MAIKIRFLGIAAYEITLPDERKILIDPCITQNPGSPTTLEGLDRVDLVLVTHLAGDHMGDAPEIVKRFNCPVVCGKEVQYYLQCLGVQTDLIRTVPWHGQVNPLGIRVRSIPSMHASVGLAPDGKWLSGQPMGFLLYASDDCRIYHSGDTAIFSDLKLVGELYQPDIGLMCACELEKEYLESLGLKDHYGNEMSGKEGALASMWMGLKFAHCCHYIHTENHKDIEEFSAMLTNPDGPKPVILEPGQEFIYTSSVE